MCDILVGGLFKAVNVPWRNGSSQDPIRVIALVSVFALVVTILEYQCTRCCKAWSPSAIEISFEVWMLRTDIPASDV